MEKGNDVRRYDDPVEVRKGWVSGPGHVGEGPEQFLWRGRLWQVRAVLAHWVETGSWWQSTGARAVIGSEESEGSQGAAAPDLLEALKAALEWIDAVPADTSLPAMPGFDRDEVNALIENAGA